MYVVKIDIFLLNSSDFYYFRDNKIDNTVIRISIVRQILV